MPDSWKAKYISPMLAVGDMERAIAFYREVLGFKLVRHSPGYSIIERDDRLIHLKLAWAPDEVMATVRLHTEIYLEVSGIHALWEHVKQFKDRYQIRDIFDRKYGMTEFHIRDADNFLIFVGEVTVGEVTVGEATAGEVKSEVKPAPAST